jgi:predicted membrane-bound spermidine synthase
VAARKKQARAAATVNELKVDSSARASFRLLVAAVFFAGVASLIYEVVWIRVLGLSLGSTAVAFSVMLTAFLGGLALGGWYMGMRSDSMQSPIRTLILVEVAAAVLGVLAIPALKGAGRAYVYASVMLAGSPGVSLFLRSAVALVVMMIPATLFGMTFPLATVAGGRMVGGQKSAGTISAASSFGSAVGALLCGLWLEPAFGLFMAAAIGAGVNLVAAGAALLAHRLNDR